MAPRTKGGLHVAAFHSNTDQELINITSDKLELTLSRHLKKIEDTKAWQVPSTLLISLIALFCTTEFKAAFGMEAASWKGIFVLVALASVGWLIWALLKLRNKSSLQQLLCDIKNTPLS